MIRSVIPHLYCPVCSSKIRLREISKTSGPHIISGALVCSKNHHWPITRGIPRFVKQLPPDKEATANRFGRQWLSFSAASFSSDDLPQFLSWIRPVKNSFFKKKVVLDAGCGSGRHLIIASRFSPKTLVGIDLSDSVELAFAKTKDNPRIHILQADILNPPFKKSFDYIYSIGVIHHLPNPKEGFKRLTRLLKPKGAISAWLYGAKGNEIITSFVNPLRLALTSHLPLPILSAIALPFSIIIFTISRTMRLVPQPIIKHLPLRLYLSSLSGSSFGKIYLIIYDHLNAPTAHYLTRADTLAMSQTTKFRSVKITPRLGNSWCLFGRL